MDRFGTTKTILTVLAKTDKEEEKIDFEISLKDAYLQMKFVNVSDFGKRSPVVFSTDFYSLRDVLIFENDPKRKMYDKEIVKFYWSKSMGYVRLIQKDGTVWDLKSIQ